MIVISFSDKKRFCSLSGCLASKCPQWKLFGTFKDIDPKNIRQEILEWVPLRNEKHFKSRPRNKILLPFIVGYPALHTEIYLQIVTCGR